jgi:Holliday junction resolvase-like predicted endonuclease
MSSEIKKSTRHSKIAGDFGETLVLYWLSKSGFECAKIDHTGIDLIASNPHTNEIMGISVKSRTRLEGKETESVTIPADDFDKIDAACHAFHCSPYFAIVVDAKDSIKVFITSKAHLLELFPKRVGCYWKMSRSHLERYTDDPQVMAFEFQTKHGRWWKTEKPN